MPKATARSTALTIRPRASSAVVESTNRLRDAITSGDFQPNERLVEKDLVALLGASRGSIRVVLARLEREGLVAMEPNRGARVRLVSSAEAIEIVETRAVLEGLAARYAALNVTSRDATELKKIMAELRSLRKGGDLLAYADKNRDLHSLIARISGHQTAASLLQMLKSQSVTFQYRSILRPGRADQSIKEHEALVAAVIARDPDAAEAAMRAHLGQAVSALKESIGGGRSIDGVSPRRGPAGAPRRSR